MMPMEPANAVRSVLAFLVRRLLKLRLSAVEKLIFALPMFLCSGTPPSSGSKGSLSPTILPSLRFTMRVA